MASLLLGPIGQFGKAFTPPQFNATEYDGPEYVVYKWIVFRPGRESGQASLLRVPF